MEEHSLPTAGDSHSKLLFRIDGTVHTAVQRAMGKLWTDLRGLFNERHPDRVDADYPRRLRKVEHDIEEEQPRIRIRRYDEGGGGRDSWQKWIMGIVSVSLVGMLSWALGKLDTLNQEVATLQATQSVGFAAIAQRQTADEQRIDRIESRLYRNPQ